VSALPEHLRAVVECVRGRLGARLVAKPGTVGLLLVAGHPVPERVMVESTVLGARVAVLNDAHITADGLPGGGEVLIGGDWQGAAGTPTAHQTLI
jgi:hypothetical protein